ncbi:hypothetical protein [Inquilinus sp. Marseille-Q2685]|uniref:hypothetical protein n=1 Tax=Inquilinus sp. Marseille-Q2685 TaxID=2866581 RepID=UPI001CE4064F|nr:hypothetical protein [Inquilinus sp. Marseille-Q2685]
MSKRTTRRRRSADPLTQMVEMTVAAGHTIGHRSLMLAQAAGDPVALRHPEFTRMVTEKMAVAVETGAEMTRRLAESQWGWVGWFGVQAQLGAVVLAANPATAWQHWLTASTGQAAAIGQRLMADAAALADAGLAPAHRVASANARRLRRKKR